MKTVYVPYIGNVTRRDPKGPHRDGVVWEKDQKLNEANMASMLNDAYIRGRQEAILEFEVKLAELKK